VVNVDQERCSILRRYVKQKNSI